MTRLPVLVNTVCAPSWTGTPSAFQQPSGFAWTFQLKLTSVLGPSTRKRTVQTQSLPEKRMDAVTGHGLRSREDAVKLLEEIERGQGVAR